MCIYMNVYVIACPKKTEEDVRVPGARVAGSYESLDMGAGNHVQSSERAASTLNCQAICPAYFLSFLDVSWTQ